MQFDDPDALGFDPERLARIPPLLDGYVASKRLSGYNVLVAREGRAALLNASGKSAFEGGFDIAADSIFRIYSMTKPITSLAVMMLCEEGGLRLDDPIHKFLPDFKDMQVFESGTTQDIKTRPAERDINVRDLLTHQAGFTYDFLFDHPVSKLYHKAGLRGGGGSQMTLEKFAATLAELPLVFSPGTQWNYSVATDLCGRLVEVVSGQTLDQFFTERIFTPLGMHDTSFFIADDKRDRLTTNYARNPLTREITIADTPEDTGYTPARKFLSGGGGLLSTIGDYYLFCDAMRRGGRNETHKLVGRKTAESMRLNHLTDGALMTEHDVGGFAETGLGGTGFGLGFSVVVNPAQTPVVSSKGNYSWGGLASTFFWIDPVEDMIVILMTQMMPSTSYPLRPQLQQLVYASLD